MPFVYILQSQKTRRYYIGSTDRSVGRRLQEHNAGQTPSLSYQRPLTIRFQKEYPTTKEARKIERKLKVNKSRKILERIIQDQEIHMSL